MYTKDNKTTVQEGYDVWASTYDEYPNPTLAIDDLNFPEMYADLEECSILEIGCGTGRHTSRLLDQSNKVTAVDVSEGMLTLAKERLAGRPVNFIHGDFLELDQLHGEPFDAVVMSLVLEHVEELDSFFQKLNSHLLKGGVFLFSEIHPERAKSGKLAHFKDSQGNESWLGSTAHSSEAIKSAASKFGFAVKTQRSVSGDKTLAAMNAGWEKYIGKPMIEMWKMEKC
jgi:malonyl-CoA O-methyltransferase